MKKLLITLLILCFNIITIFANPNDIFDAIKKGDVLKVKHFLEAGVNPNAQHSQALIDASSGGHTEIVQLLLAANADPNAQDSQALIEAAKAGYFDIAKLLLDAKANPMARDSQALSAAAFGGHFDIVKLLLDATTDPTQIPPALLDAASMGHIEIFKLLIAAINADPETLSQALNESTHAGHFDIVKLLLEANVNPNAPNSRALTNAAFQGHSEIVKLLLEANVDPKTHGSKALIKAASQGHLEIVQLLLAANANPNAHSSQALIEAAKNGNIEIVQLLFTATANPNAQNSQAFINAASQGHIEIVKLLLAANADLNAQNSQALINAAFQGHSEIVKLLLEANSDPNAQDSKALIGALSKGNKPIVELLLKHGADSSILNIHALHEHALQFIKNSNLDAFILMHKSTNLDLSHYKIVKAILLSCNHDFVKYLFDNVPTLKDAYIIGVGLSHTRGETTGYVLEIIANKLKSIKNAYHLEISSEIAQDEDIMQHLSGLINPGAGDSYPRHEQPFTLEDMSIDDRMYHEKVYQQVITMAKKYDIPYLGICAGSQHLVLNSTGSLKKGGHNRLIEINFIPGTIPHFLLLTEEEKSEALSTCKLDPIKLTDASTAHGYAGYIDNLGEGITLAALSEAGIPEAYSLGANKIGSQFHPENRYNLNDGQSLNRHKLFLDNIFGIFEGYYRSMQYAKKMGIDKAIAKAAIQKVNQQLVEHLENCVKNKDNTPTDILWAKGQNSKHNSNVKTVSLLPGITPEDIAFTRDEESNLVISSKDDQGKLTILDSFNASQAPELLLLKFADGSVIELNPADTLSIESDKSYSASAFLPQLSTS